MGKKKRKKEKSPVREYRTILNDSGDPSYVNRLLIATPTTGLVRVEWMTARYGQVIPANWSMVQMNQFVNGYIALRYQVDDAQNMIVKAAVEKDFEWLLLLEHDVIWPANAIMQYNKYILKKKVPIISGLYYTRSRPSEPLVYRGRGTSYYPDWKQGDKVWVDGVPTGCLLIHCGILRVLWDESPEYMVGKEVTRRVFNTPRDLWFDPESNQFNTLTGTSDLAWCTRIMEEDVFKKAGWKKFAKKKYPFLIDTNIFCRHINPNGEQFP